MRYALLIPLFIDIDTDNKEGLDFGIDFRHENWNIDVGPDSQHIHNVE